MKVIFHVDEMDRWGVALTNIRNLITYCEERDLPCELELLANAEAVQALAEEDGRESGIREDIGELSRQKVKIAACQNALKKFKIREEQLYSGVSAVPAGVAELAEKQAEGFAYIKP